MKLENIFWEASIDDLKKGYVQLTNQDSLICLVCGEVYELGVIYQVNNKMMIAERAVKEHIQSTHGSMFEFLLSMDKKYTSLTENQKNLVEQFASAKTDKELAKELGVSSSTIRSQRFTMREKVKQAKIYLSIMELMEDRINTSESADDENQLVHIHRNATAIDDRYAITLSEKEKMIETYFDQTDGLKLREFPKKQKRKVVILDTIANQFDTNKKYTEKEVNEIISTIYSDYVTIRRYLIEYGFLDRTRDGSAYWLKV